MNLGSGPRVRTCSFQVVYRRFTSAVNNCYYCEELANEDARLPVLSLKVTEEWTDDVLLQEVLL